MASSPANRVGQLLADAADRTPEPCVHFVESAGIRWFVRRQGHGPVLLLLHGTGSSSASWHGLFPLLADRFTLVAPDLPGHGLTSALARGSCSLPEMARVTAALMGEMALAPVFIAGHSAGAAISAQMALDGVPSLRRLAWIAAALMPFGGVAGRLAPPLARLLARSSLLPHVAAWRARSDAAVRRMIASTGSTLDERGVETYGALLRRPGHVAGALAMMGGWDLAPLNRGLPSIDVPVLLLHGDADRIVPVRQSDEASRRLRSARFERLPALGHLAHEEQPRRVALEMASWFDAEPPA